MSASSTQDRLLKLLHRRGILYASPTQPVTSRDGKPARWMLDSLAVSLGTDGVALAGESLLELLARFEGRQIATYGMTAITLLTSCILQSNGRYHGLIVRSARKAHGSSKLIEGRIDPDEPVIIVDDSVSSGTNMTACCKILEDAGLWVEGGVCLVRFGWYGGFALMQERGYHMESVFDVWEDFIYEMPDEPDRVANPTRVFPPLTWQEVTWSDGIDPPQLARRTIDHYLRGDKLPQPPAELLNGYDAAGGAWISVRSKENIYRRHARDGFWNFPGERQEAPARAVAMAAAKTAHRLPQGEEGLRLLDESAIAVTFFSRLEPCSVGQLDNNRYGIVVRSRERPSRMGGALPRMPGIVNAWQQFQHARRKNAGLVSFEPYELLRHDVVKVVEPGVTWQPTGVPLPSHRQWYDDPDVAGLIASRSRELVLEALNPGSAGMPLAAKDGFASQLDTVFVTVYVQGRIRGCMGTAVHDLEADLQRLAGLAIADRRFAPHNDPDEPAQVAVTVSMLYNPLDLGAFEPAEVIQRVRHGRQALMVSQGGRTGLLLPQVAAANSLSAHAYALEVIDKAGITRPPYHWRRYDCTTWLADATGGPRPLRGTQPIESAPDALDQLLPRMATLFAQYLLRHQRDDGRLYYRYLPLRNVLYEGGDLPRIAHGAWVLCRAGAQLSNPSLQLAGDRLTSYLRERVVVAGDDCWIGADETNAAISELSFLALALMAGGPDLGEHRELAARLASMFWSRIDRHGRISTHRNEPANADTFQDYFPGQALLALAAACAGGVSDVQADKLSCALRRYRHRFRFKRDFGAVSWLMQAFACWHRQTGDEEFSEFVFEMGDWLLEFQQVDGGGFINEHQYDSPGYTTGLYLEGLGAATRLAEAIGDGRGARYREACRNGFRFLDGLVIRKNMSALLPNPDWAIGGLRQSAYRDDVRIDFVQHALSAVLELFPSKTQQP